MKFGKDLSVASVTNSVDSQTFTVYTPADSGQHFPPSGVCDAIALNQTIPFGNAPTG